MHIIYLKHMQAWLIKDHQGKNIAGGTSLIQAIKDAILIIKK